MRMIIRRSGTCTVVSGYALPSTTLQDLHRVLSAEGSTEYLSIFAFRFSISGGKQKREITSVNNLYFRKDAL